MFPCRMVPLEQGTTDRQGLSGSVTVSKTWDYHVTDVFVTGLCLTRYAHEKNDTINLAQWRISIVPDTAWGLTLVLDVLVFEPAFDPAEQKNGCSAGPWHCCSFDQRCTVYGPRIVVEF